MIYCPAQRIWYPSCEKAIEPSPPARGRLARRKELLNGLKTHKRQWTVKEWLADHFVQGLINGGLVNAGHALVNGGIIRAHTTAPTLAGPLFGYRLEEASGTRVDAVGGTPNCDLTATNNPGNTTGKIGNAVSLSHSSAQSLSCSSNTSNNFGDSDFTFGGWLNVTSYAAGGYFGIVSKSISGHLQYGALLNATTHKIEWYVNNFAGEVDSNVSLSTGTWYCFTVYHDSVNNILFVTINDQASPNTASYSGGLSASTNTFWIGDQEGTRQFDGAIDAVYCWNSVLSSGDRTSFYNGGNGTEYYSGAWH